MMHCTTRENRSKFLTSLKLRGKWVRLRFFVDKIEGKLLPEDTHALLCVPVVEELQAGDEEKLGLKEKLESSVQLIF